MPAGGTGLIGKTGEVLSRGTGAGGDITGEAGLVSGGLGIGFTMLCPGKDTVLFSASPNLTPVGGRAGEEVGLDSSDGVTDLVSAERTDDLISNPLGTCPAWADFMSLSMVLMEERGSVMSPWG